MDRNSPLSLVAIACMLTVALFGMSVRWELIGVVAPLGRTDLAPLIFLPLLLATIHAGNVWLGYRLSSPSFVIRIATLIGLAGCIFVVTQHDLKSSIKLSISLTLVAMVVFVEVLWRLVPSQPVPVRDPHDISGD